MNIAAVIVFLLWAPAALSAPPVDPELLTMLRHAVNESRSFSDRFDAQVWLLDMSQRLASRIKDPAARLLFLKTLHHESTRAGLKPELVLAVVHVESNFDRFAISRVGARGLMQIMPFWLRELGRGDDNLFELQTNLRYGCTILKHYIDKENGNLRRALARYNGSLGRNTYTNRVFGTLRKYWYRQ